MKKIIILLASLIPLSAMAESISMNFVNNKAERIKVWGCFFTSA